MSFSYIILCSKVYHHKKRASIVQNSLFYLASASISPVSTDCTIHLFPSIPQHVERVSSLLSTSIFWSFCTTPVSKFSSNIPSMYDRLPFLSEKSLYVNICLSFVLCSKHRITQRTVRCVYIHIPVVSEEFPILIIVQSLEHSSTGHVVSIHDRIKIRKSSGICRVYEDCSIRAVLPICIMAQIITVVTALQYRIIDICSRYVYPRTYILILF